MKNDFLILKMHFENHKSILIKLLILILINTNI